MAFYNHNATGTQAWAATHPKNPKEYVEISDMQLNAILAADEAFTHRSSLAQYK